MLIIGLVRVRLGLGKKFSQGPAGASILKYQKYGGRGYLSFKRKTRDIPDHTRTFDGKI